MDTNTSAPSYCLDHLSNDDLLASTRRMVGCSNLVLAGLLAHLAEVEARGIHRLRSCSSLYTYCVYELRMSEDSALRRAHAARIARRFPALFAQSGDLLLVVRELDPLPDVPARVEPLGPASVGLSLANPSWPRFVASFCGPVRQLEPGERPGDWVEADMASSTAPDEAAGTRIAEAPESEQPACRTPQRYKVQFTATEEYVDLLEQARDLLAHAVRDRSLEELHLRAMRLLVAELKKRKYAVTDKPRRQPSSAARPAEARSNPRQRGRYVPAAVRQKVWERDGGRCTYVAASGERCAETGLLELHHEVAHALGGPPTAANISLRCRAHNELAADEDFGRDFMAHKKGAAPAPARGMESGP